LRAINVLYIHIIAATRPSTMINGTMVRKRLMVNS
jgi:hypothetical protein